MPSTFRFPETDPVDNKPPSAGGTVLRAVLGFVGSLLILTFVVVTSLADVVSCFRPYQSRAATFAQEPRRLNPVWRGDAALGDRFGRLWAHTGNERSQPDLWVLDAREINAASFGDQRFILWSGLRQLPDWAQDGVFAHEIAHDRLEHSKRTAELRDVTDWVGEALGVTSDASTAQTLKEWSGKLIIPTYSRQQEMEADSVATVLLRAAGYPDGVQIEVRTLGLLREKAGDRKASFFASHPAVSERINRLKSLRDST